MLDTTARFLVVLSRLRELYVAQKREPLELLGIETRNQYAIEAEGARIGYARERSESVWDGLARHFLGHWRRFEIELFDSARELVLRAVHPFRFFLQRLELTTPDGQALGVIQQRLSFVSKCFDVVAADGKIALRVRSSLFSPWAFELTRHDRSLARIEKKWSGLLRETFTDADTFRVVYSSSELSPEERALVLVAAVFVDLSYFEHKAR
jgi:uncharacterized protein YxjI